MTIEKLKKQIVVFDDDVEISYIVSYIMGDSDWEVISHTDCKNILEKVANLKPALIIMDNKIPDIGGVEATKMIKASELFKHIPVIFCSAANEVAKLAKEAGSDTYIPKPFDIEDFERIAMEYALE